MNRPHAATPSRLARGLSTAHATWAMLLAASGVFSTATWGTWLDLDEGMKRGGLGLLLSGIAFLTVAAGMHVSWARSLRKMGILPRGGSLAVFAAHAVVLTLAASTLVLGPASRTMLAGLDSLVASLLLASILSPALLSATRGSLPGQQPGPTMHWAWWATLAAAAALVVAAVVNLERGAAVVPPQPPLQWHAQRW